MKVIRIDDEVWKELKRRAEPLEDNPNDVLRKEFGLDVAKKPNTRPRLPRGQFTSVALYRLPIMHALYELGGKAKAAIVLARVEEIMKEKLSDADRQLTANKLPRWSRNAQNERHKMVEDGLMNKKPHGIWELTEKGMLAAKKLAVSHGW